jgi:Rieske Fe-S protein
MSRRDFLKIMGGVSAVLAAAPFAAAGQYLIPQVPTTFKPVLIAKKQDVPVNGSIVFWFPFTTDPTYTNILIHLPPNLASKAGKEFVAYNRMCIHLQCHSSPDQKSSVAHVMEASTDLQMVGPSGAQPQR